MLNLSWDFSEKLHHMLLKEYHTFFLALQDLTSLFLHHLFGSGWCFCLLIPSLLAEDKDLPLLFRSSFVQLSLLITVQFTLYPIHYSSLLVPSQSWCYGTCSWEIVYYPSSFHSGWCRLEKSQISRQPQNHFQPTWDLKPYLFKDPQSEACLVSVAWEVMVASLVVKPLYSALVLRQLIHLN